MMKRLTAVLVFFACLSAGWATAGETGVVILKDGSVVKGEIVSMDGNTLTLTSGALGTVIIESSQIDSIRFDGSADIAATTPDPSTTVIDGQLQRLHRQVVNDPEIMEMILALAGNPEFQNALKDPELMDAINARDIEKLMSHPAFVKLLDDPGTRSIQKKLEP